MSTESHRYLRKANNDLVSHCDCDNAEALITFPPQMDCPWCGCGWLFTCIQCRKAFTFAEAVETDVAWDDLAHIDLRGRSGKPRTRKDERAGWVKEMKRLVLGVEIGASHVYFDGRIIQADRDGIDHKGWHGKHSLQFVPQIQALEDSSIIDEILTNADYWHHAATTV